MCEEMEVPYAGAVSLDRDLLMACEKGLSIMDVNAASVSAMQLNGILTHFLGILGLPAKKTLHVETDSTTGGSSPGCNELGVWSSS